MMNEKLFWRALKNEQKSSAQTYTLKYYFLIALFNILSLLRDSTASAFL